MKPNISLPLYFWGRQSTVDKVLSSASSELEMHVEIWEQGGIKMLDVNLSNVDSDLESRRVGLNGMAKDMFSFAFEVFKDNSSICYISRNCRIHHTSHMIVLLYQCCIIVR